ncbi:uncharacterized protein J3R85_019587 [Psidium guajava]|nr:uncharacterized protein J3R85_019587 [Psidium guajava]
MATLFFLHEIKELTRFVAAGYDGIHGPTFQRPSGGPDTNNRQTALSTFFVKNLLFFRGNSCMLEIPCPYFVLPVFITLF